MIAELGLFALVLSLIVAVVQSTLPFLGARWNDNRLMAVGSGAALTCFLLVGLSFAALTHAYVVSDFSIANVWQNSHSLQPLLYRYTSVWGNHEGSILLWVLILTLFSALLAVFAVNLPAQLKANVLAVQGWITVSFLLFVIFTSNPFERLPVPQSEGKDLNPILQDIGLAIHPPLLYIGYVGFSLTFAFAVAALISGKIDGAWAKYVRPWSLLAWSFLTGGIAMGSYWAYYELGWGGWWFWDPVENASFMPWLVGTALIHSVLVMEKRDALKIWTVLLAILTFSLSLLGTFIVRSGVLTSVHSFASDPSRGLFILFILVFFIGGSLSLFALRANTLQQGGLFQPISREGALVFNNLFLTVASLTVLLGTLYPLFLEAVDGSKISVGGPYFNATFGPIMIPLLLAVPFGMLMSWKRSDLLPVLQRLYFAAAGAFIAVLVVLWLVHGAAVGAAVLIGVGVWVMLGSLAELYQRSGLPRTSLSVAFSRLKGLPRSTWGSASAHFGLGLMLIGIVTATAFSTENAAILKKGESFQIEDFTLINDGFAKVEGPNYVADVLAIRVKRDGDQDVIMSPQKRYYTGHRSTTTEADLKTYGFSQLYVSLGDTDDNGGTVVRSWWKSQVLLVWIGPLLMMFGGFLSLSDRRMRVGIPKASRLKGQTVNA